jgi:hypothetical protein
MLKVRAIVCKRCHNSCDKHKMAPKRSISAVPDSLANIMPSGVFDNRTSFTFQTVHSRDISPSPLTMVDDDQSSGDDEAGQKDDQVAIVGGSPPSGSGSPPSRSGPPLSGSDNSDDSDDAGSDHSSPSSGAAKRRRSALHVASADARPVLRPHVVAETQYAALPHSAVVDSVQEIAGKVRLLPRPPLPSPPKLVSLPAGVTWASPSPPRRSFYFP